MDELLLDRATLKELGMDVGAVLEQARVSQLDQARASQGKQLYIPVEEMRPKSKDDVMRKQEELVRPSEDRRPVKRVRRSQDTRKDNSNDEQSYEGVRWGTPEVEVFDFPETTKPQKVDEAQITLELENLVDRAKAKGASEELSKNLRTEVYKYRDVGRTRMSGQPPAKLKPTDVKLRPGVAPVQSRQRKLKKEAAKFVTDTVRELIDANIMFHNPSSNWASLALAVPEGDMGKFRLVTCVLPTQLLGRQRSPCLTWKKC
jgi:hypothetical protein